MDTDERRYHTPVCSYEAVYTHEEKKSRFICHVFPVDSDHNAQRMIESIRSKYSDASHNCYAYILLNNSIKAVRFSDDGEPGGTAGQPILRSLESNCMADTLAIVTRYFGGTLLGAGGLSRAYAKTSAGGLALISRADLAECREILISAGYHEYGRLESFLRENSVTVKDTVFSDMVKISAYAAKGKIPFILEALKDITKGTADICIGEKKIRKSVNGIIL